jgi:ABC-type glycerol-3-phosphate transport system substrate-binding protein
MVQNAPLEGVFISSQAKYPVAAVKLLDFMIGPEGSDLQNWGIEGKSYTGNNGKKTHTDEVFKNPEGLSFTGEESQGLGSGRGQHVVKENVDQVIMGTETLSSISACAYIIARSAS